ncbi:MAG: hypothetical protein V1708_03145 [Candidatus Micrarchaeota archaeon]
MKREIEDIGRLGLAVVLERLGSQGIVRAYKFTTIFAREKSLPPSAVAFFSNPALERLMIEKTATLGDRMGHVVVRNDPPNEFVFSIFYPYEPTLESGPRKFYDYERKAGIARDLLRAVYRHLEKLHPGGLAVHDPKTGMLDYLNHTLGLSTRHSFTAGIKRLEELERKRIGRGNPS